MSKQRDDTTERNEPSGEEREPVTGSYYYDDSTGYEIYDPEKDAEDDEEEGEDECKPEGQARQAL
jgi:hypothetical protein